MTNPNGTWPVPHNENQFSLHVAPQETDACVAYSVTHYIESLELFYGHDIQYSERFLAKMSGTTNFGNSLETVVDTIKKYGMVLDSDWPEPVSFNWWEYYADIPQNIIDKGQEFLKRWNVGSVTEIAPASINDALRAFPLIVFTPAGRATHAREVLSTDLVFDTYPPYTEPMPTSIYGFYQIALTRKSMNQTRVVLGKDGHTVYKCIPVATDFNSFKQQANVEGILVPDVIPPSSDL